MDNNYICRKSKQGYRFFRIGFMDIYTQKSRWKWYLGIAGILIVLISLSFSIYLTNGLSAAEKRTAALYLKAMERFQQNEQNEASGINIDESDYTMITEIIISNQTIPVILYDYETDSIYAANNFGEELDFDYVFLRKQLQRMQAQNSPYIEVSSFPQRLYYKESKILTLLRYFPLVQLLLIAAFIAFGYFSFSSARRAEQNRVWAGMAKETAHQLGTPISAILGWLDHLQDTQEENEEVQEVVTELRSDVNRLELVADRFSKIGSAPELIEVNVYDELEKVCIYMQRRAPRKVEFFFPDPNQHPPIFAMLNVHLFAWVIENLLRNALDAMGNKGIISANIYEEGNFIGIDISDTGKGIPSSKWKTVFQPGYSTKKRGWGLGLSLAKRIVEEYHAGKIYIKESKEGVGTTFTIKLPKI